jgi:dTDP-4-dehydrorhamnose reductase
MPSHYNLARLEMWGGVECTVNRVGDRWFDQTTRSGHDERIEDLDAFAALGIRTLRYPVLWERVAPASLDSPDWRWADKRMHRLQALGIRPILGLLHHGSGPNYTSLLDEQFPDHLARYARMVAERYPWVTDYTPVNEPLTTARFSALYGHWYPHKQAATSFVRALLNQVKGTALAMAAIRGVIPSARLVQTEDCGRTFGTAATAPQVEHEAHRRWLTWDLLTGRVDNTHPLHNFLIGAGATEADLDFITNARCPPNVIGLNYYLTSDRFLDDRCALYPERTHGGNGRIRYADVDAVRARPEGIEGHQAHLLSAWERYRIPLAITEVHLACTREEQMRWLVESWCAAKASRMLGVDVRAVTAWALLGSYDWDSLVTCEAGHYEPGVYDVRASAPRRTMLASVVEDLAQGRDPTHPVLSTPGWWRRSERLLYGQPSTAGVDRRAASCPILIVGSTGTLGRAFARICAARGLAYRVAARGEMDIRDGSHVDAFVRAIKPWAIVNAAGYVRVDDAEREPDLCWQTNVVGAMNLASASRNHGARLVTFSSDLVFDGKSDRPYTEQDTPRPLSVYGCSKAEAEARVLELLPDALIIRTSAFFSQSDDYNFVTCAIRTIAAGASFRAPYDSVVSPTYVPDLVHATLDLLIDGERGIWHLANRGAISWLDLARASARLRGLAVDRVFGAAIAQVWGPARRPAYSALSSLRGSIMRPLGDALNAYIAAMDDEVVLKEP